MLGCTDIHTYDARIRIYARSRVHPCDTTCCHSANVYIDAGWQKFRRRCGNCSVDGNSAGIKRRVDEFSNIDDNTDDSYRDLKRPLKFKTSRGYIFTYSFAADLYGRDKKFRF